MAAATTSWPSTTAPRACARCSSNPKARSSTRRGSRSSPTPRRGRLGRAGPELYWRSLGEACRQLWARPRCRRGGRRVALTTQRATMINVGRDGKPLRPAIVWLDQRRTRAWRRSVGRGSRFPTGADGGNGGLLPGRGRGELDPRPPARGLGADHKYLFLSGFLTTAWSAASLTRSAARSATCLRLQGLRWPATGLEVAGPGGRAPDATRARAPASCWRDHGRGLGATGIPRACR